MCGPSLQGKVVVQRVACTVGAGRVVITSHEVATRDYNSRAFVLVMRARSNHESRILWINHECYSENPNEFPALF